MKFSLFFVSICILFITSCQKEELNSKNLNLDLSTAKSGGPKTGGGKPDVSTTIKNGLVAWFPFNGNANDVSGNGNHLQNFGAVSTTDRNGNTNSAYDFQNSKYVVNSFLKTENFTPFATQQYSYSVWFRTNEILPDACGGTCGDLHEQPIIELSPNYYGPAASYSSRISGLNGDLLFCWHWTPNAGYNGFIDYSNIVISKNNWYHIVATYDGVNLTMYLNGNLMGQVNVGLSYDNNSIFLVGAEPYYQGFIGQIDDIGFWNRPLKGNEVQYLYKNGVLTF